MVCKGIQQNLLGHPGKMQKKTRLKGLRMQKEICVIVKIFSPPQIFKCWDEDSMEGGE